MSNRGPHVPPQVTTRKVATVLGTLVPNLVAPGRNGHPLIAGTGTPLLLYFR
jgi:hypothetical protein